MAHAVDNDLIFRRAVEDQIRIRVGDDPSEAALARELACLRVKSDEFDRRLNARLDLTGALGRAFVDVRKDVLELLCRAKRVSELHRPCLAQMALI